MATYLPIVPMAYQWLTFWPMVIYMELLWMFISIIFHIADPCSLSYRQTIKCTGQLQYTRIYLEKCRDKNCMIIFKIEKPRAIPQVDDYSTVLITFTIWIQTHGKINFKCSVLIMNLKSFLFYPVAVGKSIIANLARLEHRNLLHDTNVLYYQCVSHWKITCNF